MKKYTIITLLSFSMLRAAPLPVFMFDLGTGTVYDGNNSPAHAAGAVDSSFTTWHKLSSGGNITSTFNTLDEFTVNGNFGRSHGNTLNDGIDFSLAGAHVSGATPGAGIFGTNLTTSYARGRANADGRNVGYAFSGLPVGIYDVYVVLHNPNSLGSANNVGIGVLSDTPPTTSATALPWNDTRLTQTSLPANPTTASWVASENYALTRVTVSNENQFLYVLGGAFGVDQSAMSAIQIVAIPEPGTLVLVGISLGSLLLFRRRR